MFIQGRAFALRDQVHHFPNAPYGCDLIGAKSLMNQEFTILRAGAVVTNAHARRILDGVRDRFLPRPEWTHPAHLVFATGLIAEHGLAGAEEQAPDLIRAYNESVGGVNDDAQGYHHTLTIFFLRKVDAFLAPFRSDEIGARATRLLASPLAAPDYPLQFYARERLFSREARRFWVAPERSED
jgi:hypothetical protein